MATATTVLDFAAPARIRAGRHVLGPTRHFLWGENAINLAPTGAARVVADAPAPAER